MLGDFSAPGIHPSGGFTRADGRVRDRDQPEARAPIDERGHADALVWFYNLVAIANPPNGTWCQPSLARYSHIADEEVPTLSFEIFQRESSIATTAVQTSASE